MNSVKTVWPAWKTMDSAPTKWGSKIEIFWENGDQRWVSENKDPNAVIDLHCWAVLSFDGGWYFVGTEERRETSDDMREAGVLWREIGPLP